MLLLWYRAATVAATSAVCRHCRSRSGFLFCKIQARSRPWGPCQQWRSWDISSFECEAELQYRRLKNCLLHFFVFIKKTIWPTWYYFWNSNFVEVLTSFVSKDWKLHNWVHDTYYGAAKALSISRVKCILSVGKDLADQKNTCWQIAEITNKFWPKMNITHFHKFFLTYVHMYIWILPIG